jgi:hypothetical protein
LPIYLSEERIAEAIERAGNSRAKGRLLDFLIIKRTFVLKSASAAAITQSEPAYIQAVSELASCGAAATKERAYINILTIRNKQKGYLDNRYVSRGTNTTIGGNAWRPIIKLSSDRPRIAALEQGYEERLEDFFNSSDLREPKLSLDEISIWYYRGQYVESVLDGAETAEERLERLRENFVTLVRLTADEIHHLFDTTQVPISATAFTDRPADPGRYLPKLAVGLAAAPAVVTGSCSLDLVLALTAKPFVILIGPSGTGKSRAALRLAEGVQHAVSDKAKGPVFELVPVGPDWTSPKRLLGFRTPFGELRKRADGTETHDSYDVTRAIRLILRASHPEATGIPHFLVFDEMNLSHVERYFAPFLSLMEAVNILEEEEAAPLVDLQNLVTISELLQLEDAASPEAESAKLLVENGQNLKLPGNLFFIGTVNVDETTYMFSPKVLDRAHVIEIESQKPSEYLNGPGNVEPGGIIEVAKASELLRAGIDDREGEVYEVSNPATILDRPTQDIGLVAEEIEAIRSGIIATLDGCYDLLTPVGFPFGYRTTKEVFSYMHVWLKSRLVLGESKASVLANWPDALAKAVLQKVLPKIHGNKRILADSLKAMAAFLGGGHANSDPAARYTLGPSATFAIKPEDALVLPGGKQLRISKAKLEAMHDRLSATGYVSFVS